MDDVTPQQDAGLGLPNGPGAAAILAAGVGSLALGLMAFTADAWPAFKALCNLWPPSGPLSGVTTAAIAAWLLAWLVLDWRWRRRDVALGGVNLVAFLMLAAALVLTFPPAIDLLRGK
jgi:hypothetical protein